MSTDLTRTSAAVFDSPADHLALAAAGTQRATPGSETSRHLAFIDGLRALAIIAATGFHLGLFRGGFVGVEVFFVISGFLIIGQIVSALEIGRFSLGSFFVRRSFRILPLFFVVFLAVCGVALAVLPTPVTSFGFMLSAVAAPLMLSNGYFFWTQGYFDLAAAQKPLLHTWTLSVEEQFYIMTPLLLIIVSRLGRRRFGTAAVCVGVVLAAVSLWGAIGQTAISGRNAAFYLPYWRAWEFIAGGLIVRPAVAALTRARRLMAEAIGAVGLLAILIAIVRFNPELPYPSYRAVLPVVAAALVILAGSARPDILIARLLSLRWCVFIGVVSYGWYLWQGPIFAYVNILQFGEPSFPFLLGAAALSFALACLSYRYIEQPFRRWRSRVVHPGRVVAFAAATCCVIAAVGGLSGWARYRATTSFVASHYRTADTVFDEGCRLMGSSPLPSSCFEGTPAVILGDSHAGALFGSFARRFEARGIRLIGIIRVGCSPTLLAPTQWDRARRDGCGRVVDLFKQILAPVPVRSVIISSAWFDRSSVSPALLSALISQFDPLKTRVLIIGRVPVFVHSSLDCVVLSDRFGGSRERCDRPRKEIEADRAPIVAMLKPAADRFANVRYIDPIDLFCDLTTCRPFSGDDVFYRDESHLFPSGADRIYDAFDTELRWVTWEPTGHAQDQARVTSARIGQ